MNVRIGYDTEFLAALLWKKKIMINRYSINTKMITTCDDPTEQNIALMRVKQFVHGVVANSCFATSDDVEQIQALTQAGMRVIVLPADPIDQVVGMMLFAKFDAMMESRMALLELCIRSDEGDDIIYHHSDMEELGIFSAPGWWNESNLDYYPSVPREDTPDRVIPLMVKTAWADYDLDWPAPEDKPSQVLYAEFRRDEN